MFSCQLVPVKLLPVETAVFALIRVGLLFDFEVASTTSSNRKDSTPKRIISGQSPAASPLPSRHQSGQAGRSSLPRSARNMASCCQARRYFFDTARRCSSGRMVLLASTGLPFLAAVRSFALPHQPIRSRLYILCTIPDIMPAPGIPMAICIVFLCPAAMLCRHIFFPRCAKLFHFRAPFLLVVVPFL